MNPHEFDRREFHELAFAALTGAIAGSALGCNNGGTSTPQQTPSGSNAKSPASMTLSASTEELIMNEPHTCRGLNSCKGKGRDSENSCAGQGTCASIADASCSGQNDCKGLGGCGENPGMNDCKGKGGCHVPLMDFAWDKARAAFETAMKKHGKEFGEPPKKKK